MACAEHECHRCGWVGFDNLGAVSCPKCGGVCSTFYDEDFGEHEDEQERYEREQDDIALHGEDE